MGDPLISIHDNDWSTRVAVHNHSPSGIKEPKSAAEGRYIHLQRLQGCIEPKAHLEQSQQDWDAPDYEAKPEIVRQRGSTLEPPPSLCETA